MSELYFRTTNGSPINKLKLRNIRMSQIVGRLGYTLGFRSHSCSWQVGLESESDSVQCENFCIVQCSH